MGSPSTIMLTLQNNTAIPQPVSVFNPLPQQAVGGSGSGNSVQNSYTYNVHSEIADAILNNFQYVTVIYSVNGGAYQMATVNYGSVINSVSALVAALNSLNQAVFYQSSNISPNESISCYSVAPNGNSYYYSSISTNANYVTNSFTGSTTFGIDGSIIYKTGYSSSGIGTVTRINTSNAFWINNVPNTTSSPFNRAGVSSANVPTLVANGLGIFRNVNVATARQVYIGLSTNTSTILYLNNSPIITFNNEGVRVASINAQLGTSATNPLYQFWNIYPINLNAGNNYILINTVGVAAPTTALSFEVYDNTASQIAAATSYAGLNLLFSSKDYTNNMV